MHALLLLCCLAVLAPIATSGEQEVPASLATGLKIGEVQSDRALIWGRRTKAVDGDPAAGTSGELSLAWWPESNASETKRHDWISVDAENDGAHQFVLEGLREATHYVVELRTRPGAEGPVESLRGSFTTAPSASDSREIQFVVVTGQDFHRRDDQERGHLIYAAMQALNPDFFVHTGDVLYYDKKNPEARDVETARFHWHRMYTLPLQREFHLDVPAYFLKDDHDTLKDDCWPGQTYGDLSFQRGVELFREQTPSPELPYRRVRWGKHLEVWFLEGREFRSSNKAPDGPGKTILGEKQLEWLARTLKESDATYRVVVSATPIVGPDRSSKADNHSNSAFAHEGQRLRRLLASYPRTFVVCGDRHWQYTSVDAETDLWEFSCGPTTDAHAGGFSEKQRTESHRYLAVRGGFLSVSIELGVEANSASFVARHHDTNGQVLNEHRLSE